FGQSTARSAGSSGSTPPAVRRTEPNLASSIPVSRRRTYLAGGPAFVARPSVVGGPSVVGRQSAQPSPVLAATSPACPPQRGQPGRQRSANPPAGSSQSRTIGYRRAPRRTSTA